MAGLIDSSGTQVVSYSYDSWGRPLGMTDSTEEQIGSKNPFRYRQYFYDAETGLYYLGSRYYDPEVGRFINADDVDLLGANGDFASLNLFVYCGNNPVSRADSSGYLWTNALIGAVVGAVAGLLYTNQD